MTIIRSDEVIDYDGIDKRDLAELVNRQSAQLQQSERQRAILFRVLVAIARDPAVVRPIERGYAVVDRAAVEAVDLAATRLNIHPLETYLEIVTIDEPPRDSSPIVTPRIIWPS